MKEKLKMLVVMMVLLALVFALPVLAEGQDGQNAVLLDLTQLAQTIPRIFLQETKACIEGSTAPALNRIVSDLIHLVYDRMHLLGCHSCRNQGLVRITQHRLCYF